MTSEAAKEGTIRAGPMISCASTVWGWSPATRTPPRTAWTRTPTATTRVKPVAVLLADNFIGGAMLDRSLVRVFMTELLRVSAARHGFGVALEAAHRSCPPGS